MYNSANLSKHEAVLRIVAGTMMILAVLILSTVPSWLALVAIYPISTGIISWDPITGLFVAIRDSIISSIRKARTTPRKAYSA